jgi:hypothetical protein
MPHHVTVDIHVTAHFQKIVQTVQSQVFLTAQKSRSYGERSLHQAAARLKLSGLFGLTRGYLRSSFVSPDRITDLPDATIYSRETALATRARLLQGVPLAESNGCRSSSRIPDTFGGQKRVARKATGKTQVLLGFEQGSIRTSETII